MQPKESLKIHAIKLRQKGLSYSEITRKLDVSKASLSLWLRTIRLTTKQRDHLAKLSLIGQQAGAKARHRQRLNYEAKLSRDVSKELPYLVKDPLFTLGLALYWGEGSKLKSWRPNTRVTISNSDPLLHLVTRKWLLKFGKINQQDITYRLYIHRQANAAKALNAWAKLLTIQPRLIRISYKNHLIQGRVKHSRYIGQMSMTVRKSVWLNRRIELWIKHVSKHYLQKNLN